MSTGRVFKRGQTWWLDYGFRGNRHRESSGSHRKSDAVALMRRRMEEMGKGRVVGPQAEKLTFEDLEKIIRTDYKVNARRSLPRLESALSNLRRTFGDRRALDITTDRVTAYILARQEEGAAASTIRNEVNALKRAFNLAVQAGRLASRPHVPTPKLPAARKGFFEKAELAEVLKGLPAYFRPAVEFMALTGWRKNEVLTLTWAQVDFEAGMVRLEPGTTKNGEGRAFPVSALPQLEALLRAQEAHTKALARKKDRIITHVFHRDGNAIRYPYKSWRAACKIAGVPGMWIHDLRRTAVRNLERAGVPRSVAMKLTGHKTESIYRRYAIVAEHDLAEGVAKLARLHETSGAEARRALSFVPSSGTKTAQSGSDTLDRDVG